MSKFVMKDEVEIDHVRLGQRRHGGAAERTRAARRSS